MRKLLMILTLMSLVLIPVTAVELGSMNDLVSYALAGSYSYMQAVNQVNNTAEALEDDTWYEDYSATVGSNAKLNSTSDEWSASLSLDLPMNDYFSIDANLDTDLDGSLGISIDPLAQPESTVGEELAYEDAILNLSETKMSITNDVISAFLDYLIAVEELELQEKQTDIAKQTYEEEVALYELGESTLIEVQEELDSYSDELSSISSYQNSLSSTKTNLMMILGCDAGEEIVLPEIDLSIYEGLAQAKDRDDYETAASVMGTYDVITALNDVTEAQDDYDRQRVFDPDLRISSDIDTAGEITASVSFSIGFDDYLQDDKDDLYEDLEIKQEAAFLAINTAKYDLSSLIESIAYDKVQIEDARRQIEMTQLLIDEAEILLSYDEYEELDYESLLLSMESQELSLLKEIIDWYEHQLEMDLYLL